MSWVDVVAYLPDRPISDADHGESANPPSTGEPLDSTTPLIAASALVLVFYALDVLASRWRIPSVLFLVAVGIGARFLTDNIGLSLPDIAPALPVLGFLGLGLVVLEGALELKFRAGHTRLAFGAGISAILGIFLFAFVVAFTLRMIGGETSWRLALLNALPLAIISSAIAIPSAARLPSRQKEFVAFESSFADILGVLVFNALVAPAPLGFGTLARLGGNAALTLGLSLLVCAGLLVILARSTHKVRFFPLLAGLILCYALGKYLHLSSLLLLLCFGLIFANLGLLPDFKGRDLVVTPRTADDAHLLEVLVRETTFVVRTFFFFAFGFTLPLSELANPESWIAGLLVLATIYSTRALALRIATGGIPRALLFLAPRGLVSILLFGAIPLEDRSPLLGSGSLLFVVLGSSLLQVLSGRAVADAAQVPLPSILGGRSPDTTREDQP